MTTDDPTLDLDTFQHGTDGPFATWEGDLTALVHVCWAAKHRGWTLVDNADDFAAMVRRSRWLAAREAFARADGVTRAANYVRDMTRENFTRREVIELLDYLAEQGPAR